MSELLQQFLATAQGMWHRRWIGLVAAWVAAFIAVGIVYRIPERYEASARVYVDTETLLKPLLQGLSVQPNLDQQVALISRTLISRPNVEQLIRMADLDLGVKTGTEREDLIDHVTKNIQLTGSSSTNLYVISYRDPSPEVAKKVVQSLLTIFVESSLGDKRQDSRTAVQFLDDQIKRYEQTLKAAEDRLKEFKLKYLGVNTQQGQDYFGRLSQLRAAIDASRLELSAAEQSRDTYKRQLADQRAGETPPSLVDDTDARASEEGVSEVDGRIAALQQDLDKLLRMYTDEHPDVVATRRLIANLQQQRRSELAARKKATAAAGGQSFASERAKVDGYEAQYRQWQAQAQLVPKAEAEYAQLNRDYEVQKKTYDSLLTRRAAAGMGMDAQDTGGARFRVIDPPRVSPEPVAPTRVMLLCIAFIASIGAGLVASLIASQLRPIFHDARTLREFSNRPVLGMVSMLSSEPLARLRRRKAYLFAGGLGGLLVTLSGVVAFALLFGRVV